MTRPDQTRPDQTATHGLKSFKEFLKRHDRFHILRGCKEKIDSCIYSCTWGRDRKIFSPFGRKLPGAKPYIIRRHFTDAGLFSYFNTALGGIAYADINGFVPVVDMKNYPNAYLYPDEVGRANAWEYYFEQPGGISLEEALSSRKYILGRDTILHRRPSQNAELKFDYTELFCNIGGCLDYWRSLCRKYIRFKPEVIERLGRMKEKYSGRKILGLLVRGTDYTYLKPKNHPIPPTPEQAIAKAREAMQEHNFDSVYLATEDKRILADFQGAFGGNLILPEADYLDYDYDSPKYLVNLSSSRKNDKYLRGLEYLVSMLFLSGCAGFITSGTSGSTGVICLSGGFEYLYFFDLGVY